MEQNENTGDILIYQSENGLTRIDVRLEQETVWLTQQQMAELFQTSRTNVVEHIQHIYEEGELSPEATCRNFSMRKRNGSWSSPRRNFLWMSRKTTILNG